MKQATTTGTRQAKNSSINLILVYFQYQALEELNKTTLVSRSPAQSTYSSNCALSIFIIGDGELIDRIEFERVSESRCVDSTLSASANSEVIKCGTFKIRQWKLTGAGM